MNSSVCSAWKKLKLLCTIGETSRTLDTRSREHDNGLKKHKAYKPMHKHMCNHPPGQRPCFLTKATKFFSDPLTRQINEGVGINPSKLSLGLMINSKSEFLQGVLARVTVK